MPLLKSRYSSPYFFRNYHLSTVYASQLRKAPEVNQRRKRLELKDTDFIDLDWSYAEDKTARNVVLILHGLDGNAQRPYILGMASIFNQHDWDAVAINFRGCSGEINRLYRSYNAGASEDLEEIIQHILHLKKYENIAIIGFSLGGNLLLKYLGEGNKLPSELKTAVAISVPCDLYNSLKQLEKPQNRLYSSRFVKKLKEQLQLRSKIFPDEISEEEIKKCKTLFQIDDLYTSRAHGFTDVKEYYSKSSSLQFLENIAVPVLLLSAKNDAFLSASSYPYEIAKDNPFLYLETPKYGGHVGFLQHKKYTYAEERALEFLKNHV